MTSLVLNRVRWADPLSSIPFIGQRHGALGSHAWLGAVKSGPGISRSYFQVGGDGLGLSWHVWDSVCWSAVWGWQVVVNSELDGWTVVGTDQACEMRGNPEPLKKELGLSVLPGSSQGSSPLPSVCVSYLVVLVELGKYKCKEAWLPTLPVSLIHLT